MIVFTPSKKIHTMWASKWGKQPTFLPRSDTCGTQCPARRDNPKVTLVVTNSSLIGLKACWMKGKPSQLSRADDVMNLGGEPATTTLTKQAWFLTTFLILVLMSTGKCSPHASSKSFSLQSREIDCQRKPQPIKVQSCEALSKWIYNTIFLLRLSHHWRRKKRRRL